jgi:hypothetical protein
MLLLLLLLPLVCTEWWGFNINSSVLDTMISFAMVASGDPGYIRNYGIVKINNVRDVVDEEEEEEEEEAMLLGAYDDDEEQENINSSPSPDFSSSDTEMVIDISIHDDENGDYDIEELDDEERLTMWNEIVNEVLERRRSSTMFNANIDDDYDDDDNETVIYHQSNPNIRISQRAPINDEPSSNNIIPEEL